jgi:hypothetical protein
MQFGKAQEQMLQARMKANPKFGTVKAYKVDIGDGFYRVPVATSGVLKLGVLLPEMPSFSERMVAFPLVIPMGWTESPPFFCKFTETACDLTNEAFRKNRQYPAHPLEDKAGKGDEGPNPDGTATIGKNDQYRSPTSGVYTTDRWRIWTSSLTIFAGKDKITRKILW